MNRFGLVSCLGLKQHCYENIQMEAVTIDIARSLLVIYRQMSLAVQEEFRRLIAEEEDAEWRMKITDETLRDD